MLAKSILLECLIMIQCDVTFDPIIHLGHNHFDFHGPVISFYILRKVSWMNIILWDDESVRCNV